MTFQHERAHYRIEYPLRARPRFDASDGRHWPVDNCSESGFRFQTEGRLAPDELPAVGSRVSGRITFRDGLAADVAGAVVRVARGDVAVKLDPPGVPLPIVWAEQRFLLAHYPARFADNEPADPDDAAGGEGGGGAAPS
jgi:hypothetical protein